MFFATCSKVLSPKAIPAYANALCQVSRQEKFTHCDPRLFSYFKKIYILETSFFMRQRHLFCKIILLVMFDDYFITENDRSLKLKKL